MEFNKEIETLKMTQAETKMELKNTSNSTRKLKGMPYKKNKSSGR